MNKQLAQIAALVDGDGLPKYPEARRECFCALEYFDHSLDYHEHLGGCKSCWANRAHTEVCACHGTGYILASAAEAAWALVRRLGVEITLVPFVHGKWAVCGDGEYLSADFHHTPEEAVFAAVLQLEEAPQEHS